MRTAPVLAAALARPELADAPHLVIDLSGVSFLGAAGVNVLLATGRTRGRPFTHLVGVAANPAVRRAIEVTGAEQLLTVHEDLDGFLRFLGR